MRELALFAGAGGGILGGHLLGWRTRCAVEFDAYARSVLLARQRDGCLPQFPIWDDVQTFDGNPWSGSIDVVSGGFPCQDISAAGKGVGITGARSGLWSHMARIVGEVRPQFVFVENSPMLIHRGLAVVLSDLAKMGYDAVWGVLGADDAIWDHCDPCADHPRARLWILAFSHTYRSRQLQPQGCIGNERGRVGYGCEAVADAMRLRLPGQGRNVGSCDPASRGDWETGGAFNGRKGDSRWWDSEPNLGGMAHGLASPLDIHGAHACGVVGRVAKGVPDRRHRLRCIGNGQVPMTAAMAFQILMQSVQ